MSNPFTLKTLGPDQPFCDREKDLADLTAYAEAGQNVVLYSPRRYGKTSLCRRLQAGLAGRGFLTVFCDCYAVTSVDDLADRLARQVLGALHSRESLLDKGRRWIGVFRSFRPVFTPTPEGGVSLSVERASRRDSGLDVLARVLEDLDAFLTRGETPVHVTLDEFQEISELGDGRVEALLRTHIQGQRAAYCFVGSRRSVLLGMFTARKRPFYQSALLHALPPLPRADLVAFLRARCAAGGKECPEAVAATLADLSAGYSWYAQALGFHAFALAGPRLAPEHATTAREMVQDQERFGHEAQVRDLPAPQIQLLRALAADPTSAPLAADYLARWALGASTAAYSRKQLVSRDLIEKDDAGLWRVVDPFFAEWLRRL